MALETQEVARAFGQEPDHELMGLFARSLRELGGCVEVEHGGSFLALARSGDGSAEALAARLGSLPMWRDVSEHDGEPVPLFKRAQLAAADLHLQGIAPARDIGELTLFADNLVPHVLRLDGVLRFDDDLVARIDREELLEHGSPEEVEIRACAVHAVELLVAAHGDTNATVVDNVLWHRAAGRATRRSPDTEPGRPRTDVDRRPCEFPRRPRPPGWPPAPAAGRRRPRARSPSSGSSGCPWWRGRAVC